MLTNLNHSPMDNRIKEMLEVAGIKTPLASSLHDFKNPELAEAYQDSDLTPVGVGYLEDIPALKDKQLPALSGKALIIQKYRTGFYYLRKLSRPQRKAFIRGFGLSVSFIPLMSWLSTSFEDLEDFIEAGIIWEVTPEGWGYWNDLATRARWMVSPMHMYSDLLNVTKL